MWEDGKEDWVDTLHFEEIIYNLAILFGHITLFFLRYLIAFYA